MRFLMDCGLRKLHESESRRRSFLLNAFLILGIILLLVLGSVALAQDEPFLGLADFVMVALYTGLFFYLRRTGDDSMVARVGVITVGIFFSYLFFIGGVRTTAFMWLYTFPLFSLYLLGLRQGILATVLLFCYCCGFLLFDLQSDTVNVYTRDFAIRFIPSFLLVSVLAFLVEHSRSGAWDAMLEKQRVLSDTVDQLRRKEAELEEIRDQLEIRVALRTEELERANAHLRIEIEERKWAEEERMRLEAELLRAKQMELLGRLAGGVAHDLNNVLSGIVSYPDLLLLELPPESEMRVPLQNIKRAGERAAAIVQDLLTLARRGVSVKEQVQLNEIVTSYLQSPEFIALNQEYPKVRVETRLAGDLQTVIGSPVHLEKAVMNLLVNAFEAIEQEGTVVVTTENRWLDSSRQGYDTIIPGNYVVLTVTDTGVGISRENLGKIFEPFYTSKIMGRSGTGLGMTVVWGTVKDHGGYLDVESVQGRGSTITLFLPAAKAGASERAGEAGGARRIVHGSGERILLVDDAPEQRSLGNSILTTLGYRVETVASGEEAVAVLQGREVDLVLLDMIMEPGMDGLDTYRKICQLRPDQKVIIVSGYSETDRVREALELGVRSYLKKPYTLEEIASAIVRELDE
ncbi:response regulator [Desulfolithobacter sp.]